MKRTSRSAYALPTALALALWTAACPGPEGPVRYEDLVTSGRLTAAGAEAGQQRVCADETRFAVALEAGTELTVPLTLGDASRLAISACQPREPSAGAEAPPARLHLALQGTDHDATALRLAVTGDRWAEESLELRAPAGFGTPARGELRIRLGAAEGGEVLVSDLWLRHREKSRSGDAPRRSSGRASASENEPVQILLVSVDTLRADVLTGLPDAKANRRPATERADTPALAGFAESSQVYSPHYAAATWTKPSHASLLTGLPVEAHGAMLQESPLAPAVTTLAERLSDAGLRTAGLVYDCLWLDPKWGFDRGFDEYRVRRWHADQAVRFTTSWIARHRREPFFYFLHLFTPHSDMEILPYEAPGVSRTTVAEGFGVTGYGCREGSCASSLLHGIDSGRIAPLPGEGDLLRFLYHRGVENTDRALGRLFADLAESGLLDRMLVVVTSDHGEAFFEHGRLLHSTLHEEIVRVPLLVRWPGGAGAGEVRTVPTSSIDLAPTLLRAAGLGTGGLPGRALQDLRSAGESRREVFAGTVQKMVVAGPWKAIFSLAGAPPELYRLDRDPGETRNLSAEHPEILAKLQALVVRHATDARSLTGSKGVAEIPELSPEERRRLESLGYLD